MDSILKYFFRQDQQDLLDFIFQDFLKKSWKLHRLRRKIFDFVS
jgi:hypothetical protein